MTMPRIVVLLLILNTLVVLGGTAANYMMLRSIKSAGVHSQASEGAAEDEREETKEYGFFPIPKIIVSLKGKQREHYFVLDLVLQTDIDADQKKLAQIDPMVRNSVVASLSSMDFETLRSMPIADLQQRLEKALIDDFTSKQLQRQFEHVLVSKLIVQ